MCLPRACHSDGCPRSMASKLFYIWITFWCLGNMAACPSSRMTSRTCTWAAGHANSAPCTLPTLQPGMLLTTERCCHQSRCVRAAAATCITHMNCTIGIRSLPMLRWSVSCAILTPSSRHRACPATTHVSRYHDGGCLKCGQHVLLVTPDLLHCTVCHQRDESMHDDPLSLPAVHRCTVCRSTPDVRTNNKCHASPTCPADC